jgi:membrane associated rhomboid family serine protease
MLADRQYMRGDNAPTPWSITIVLLVFNILVFFLEYSDGEGSKIQKWFMEYGALSLEGLKHGFIWQFVTFQFLHGGLPHLVLNSIGLYFFGRPLEGMLGRRDFIKLYLFSGVLGGVLQVLLSLIFPQIAGPMVGASAGICGLVAAFSLLAPDSQIYLWFVLPIRGRYFLPIMFGLTLLFLVSSIVTLTESHVAHAAHLGGILGGMAYLKWQHGLRVPLFGWPRFRRASPRRELVTTRSARTSFWRKESSKLVDDLPPAEFISREVDPILDKISAHGIQSLTERERKILEAARAKMSKR